MGLVAPYQRWSSDKLRLWTISPTPSLPKEKHSQVSVSLLYKTSKSTHCDCFHSFHKQGTWKLITRLHTLACHPWWQQWSLYAWLNTAHNIPTNTYIPSKATALLLFASGNQHHQQDLLLLFNYNPSSQKYCIILFRSFSIEHLLISNMWSAIPNLMSSLWYPGDLDWSFSRNDHISV